jgi:hypothetical protein
MPSLLTLGKIGALTDVTLQGSVTISGQIISGGSNPLAFVGSFDFSGATVTGLNSGSFDNSFFTGLSTFQGPALFQDGVDFELGFDASLGTAVLGDQVWANGSNITLLGTTTVGGGSLIFTPGTTVDFGGANVSTDSITVNDSLVGSSDPLNPTQLVGYWDFGEPLPLVTQIVQVNKGGSDVTGDGTDAKPYLTVGYAVTTIIDAALTKRYIVNTGPGDYNENITLKAWVFVVGYVDLTVRFNGVIDINDPSWSTPGQFDFRSGFSNCVFRNPVVVFNFVTANSLYGKIYLQNVYSNNTISFIGLGAVNQAFLFGGFIFGGASTQAVNLFATATFFQGSTVTAISSPNAPTQVTMTACVETGNLTINDATGNTVTCSLYESFIANQVTVSGANAILLATSSSLPRRANVNVLAGATLTLLNDAAGLAYTPSVPASWPLPTPTTVQQALDDLIDGLASPIVSVDPSATAFAGGGQSPSYQITDYFTVVTTVASSGDSVVLPTPVVRTVNVIKNRGANLMDIYPPIGSSLDASPINTPFSVAPLASITYICSTATNWESTA